MFSGYALFWKREWDQLFDHLWCCMHVCLLISELNVKMVHCWVLLLPRTFGIEVLRNRILYLNSRLAALLFSDFILKLNVLFFLLWSRCIEALPFITVYQISVSDFLVMKMYVHSLLLCYPAFAFGSWAPIS